MGYRDFEDLPVWNSAIELALDVYELTATGCLKGPAGLRDQLERAALSISNNNAEGFERGTHAELLSFLYIALGSAGEVRSMLRLLERMPTTADRRPEIASLRSASKSISRQLSAWLEALKDSPHKGPRFQNTRSRQAADTTSRRDAFLETLRTIQAEHPPPGPTRDTASPPGDIHGPRDDPGRSKDRGRG